MISISPQTEDRNGTLEIYPTALRENELYIIYYNFWTKTILTELFPYCSLIFFNVCIYREIRWASCEVWEFWTDFYYIKSSF